ncbi:P-loop containing nucleoside triphosphate hydrolase protein [Microthyrium microscopicum]|uniref:P-loop containing nucleoside triphosphate hydrolase protein n=1 Tax=Microthyrium microscopicum TaxID=703497 RepID=A0A6A6UGM5_9PEZI|nr:P-loop containing nucleoside triphosphate hydrolase protein [Microthyrium microscopicum]
MPLRPSRAIPIVMDPRSHNNNEITKPYDQEWPTIGSAAAQKSKLPTSPPTKSITSGLSSREDTPSPSSTLDVYARAFVPEAYRIINEFRPITSFKAPNPRAFDYIDYVRSFGAQPYLQNRQLFEHARNTSLHHAPDYFETKEFLEYESEQTMFDNYERHFECLIGREFAHHLVEHKFQALYNQQIQPYPKNNDLYTFEWPGVREETPFIQAGDLIELRQLIVMDPIKRIILMQEWIKAFQRPSYNIGQLAILNPSEPLPPGWTGASIIARVHTVIRSRDTVAIYAPGLSGNLNFNVILPVEQKPYQARLNAISHFGRTLGSLKLNRLSQISLDKSWVEKMLFPDPQDGVWQDKLDPWSSTQEWYDDKLNFEQQKAVRCICERNYGSVPYLTSGPPGTGKTKTLVETALQLIQLPSTSHILICAPSDPAADTLLDRLGKHLGVDELFRLNAPTRNIIEMPSMLQQYCCTTADNAFTLPDFRRLMGYKIVVTSCQDSSMLVDAGLTNSDIAQFERGVMTAIHPTSSNYTCNLHWGALLLDEAAQAIEPEAVIPLSVIAPPIDCSIAQEPIFVMAGDEFQLGPRTYSHHPRLKTSLFTRLFRRPLYSDHPLARKNRPPLYKSMLPMIRPPFANLFRNYRSHPAILAFSSYTFYQDTLLTNGETIDSLKALNIWRGRKWPLLFVPNTSDEDCDKDGGGWFNNGEAHRAVAIAQHVLSSDLINEEDMCIMSPFAAQVRLLRKLCRDQNLWNVNIGPCEAFQGLESRFVILCTTRARERFLERDIEVCKGIIRQPQRLNVCLTRARHGLVVIGNPKILSVDPDWIRFMGFCQRNGLVDGELEVEGVKDEKLRLETVLLAQARDSEFNVEDAAKQLGTYTDDDMVWALGQIAEDIVRHGYEEEEEDYFPEAS